MSRLDYPRDSVIWVWGTPSCSSVRGLMEMVWSLKEVAPTGEMRLLSVIAYEGITMILTEELVSPE